FDKSYHQPDSRQHQQHQTDTDDYSKKAPVFPGIFKCCLNQFNVLICQLLTTNTLIHNIILRYTHDDDFTTNYIYITSTLTCRNLIITKVVIIKYFFKS